MAARGKGFLASWTDVSLFDGWRTGRGRARRRRAAGVRWGRGMWRGGVVVCNTVR